jgi:hypothetical protein
MHPLSIERLPALPACWWQMPVLECVSTKLCTTRRGGRLGTTFHPLASSSSSLLSLTLTRPHTADRPIGARAAVYCRFQSTATRTLQLSVRPIDPMTDVLSSSFQHETGCCCCCCRNRARLLAAASSVHHRRRPFHQKRQRRRALLSVGRRRGGEFSVRALHTNQQVRCRHMKGEKQ